MQKKTWKQNVYNENLEGRCRGRVITFRKNLKADKNEWRPRKICDDLLMLS